MHPILQTLQTTSQYDGSATPSATPSASPASWRRKCSCKRSAIALRRPAAADRTAQHGSAENRCAQPDAPARARWAAAQQQQGKTRRTIVHDLLACTLFCIHSCVCVCFVWCIFGEQLKDEVKRLHERCDKLQLVLMQETEQKVDGMLIAIFLEPLQCNSEIVV